MLKPGLIVLQTTVSDSEPYDMAVKRFSRSVMSSGLIIEVHFDHFLEHLACRCRKFSGCRASAGRACMQYLKEAERNGL